MQTLKLKNARFGTLAGVAMCLAGLIFSTDFAIGQVIIVPNKLRATRTSSKAKTKSKPKATVTLPPEPTPEPRAKPVTKSLAFAVFPPPLSKNTGKSDETPNAATASKLFGYEFDVITSDERGKVMETRKEQARYFVEELNGGATLEMVEIPGGMFSMGITIDEIEQVRKQHGRGMEKEIRERLLERLRWETPQHTVKLSAFHLSKHEITQAQWRAVAGLPKVKIELMSDPSQFKGSNRPVDSVSWEEAMEFCERLSRATGRRYRLPTEAEWEYACRAGSASPFHFGETAAAAWANYHGRYPYAAASKGVNREQTVPAGSLGIANAFGLFDMHGNVWEWCLDSWHDNYVSSPADGRSWEENGIGYLKVLRGGAWDSSAGECRVSSRNRITSSLRLNNVGFRVAAEGMIRQEVARFEREGS